MAFERGLIAIDKAVEQGSLTYGPRLPYHFWKNDGDKHILRFLTDDVIVGHFAEYIQTSRKDKEGNLMTSDFLIDPDGTNWVEHFGAKQREWGTGNLIEPKLMKRGVGVAVLRKEESIEGGRKVIVDDVHTIDVDGKKYTARKFVVIKMSIGNFWDQLRGIGRRSGTIIDIDFEITRRGKDKTTKYDISPIRAEESKVDLRDPAYLHEYYGYGRPYNENDPERYFYCPQTLDEWAEWYSGEDRATHWLKGAQSTVQVVEAITHAIQSPSRHTSGNGSASAQVTGVVSDDETTAVPSTSSRFNSVRDQLSSYFPENQPTG